MINKGKEVWCSKCNKQINPEIMNRSFGKPKPSVEKCETITISRSLAQEFYDYKQVFMNEEKPFMDALGLALSKNINGKGE